MPLGNPIRKQNESRIISVLATEGQSVFTVEGGYIINHISVFRNGVRLSNAEDFTAGDGSTVTLNNEANVDDRIEFHVFDRFTVNNSIVSAASTQTISGDLVVNGKLFSNLDVPSINTGIITATELDLNGKGDISGDLNVTGVTTVGKQIHVGTGVSIAAGGLNVTAGVSTFAGAIDVNDGGNITGGLTVNQINVTGVSTFGGNVDINANIDVSGTTTHNDDVTFTGASYNVQWDKSQNALEFSDNAKATFGGGSDLSIYHDGTRNLIDSQSTQLRIETDALRLRSDSGETYLEADANGAVKIYYDNTLRLETRANDVKFYDGLVALDNAQIQLGSSGDLKLYHDGTNSYVDNSVGGILRVRGHSSSQVEIQPKGGQYGVTLIPDGAVELYHSGTKKFETTSTGANLSGNLSIDANVIHNGDTDTMLSFSASNQVDIVCGGTTMGSFTSNGLSLGVNKRLDILDASGHRSGTINNSDSGANSLRISADPDNSGSNTVIGFHVDGSEKARITSGGQVGINTTTIVSGDNLATVHIGGITEGAGGANVFIGNIFNGGNKYPKNAQLTLGGVHNSQGYNDDGQIKLYITGSNNDGTIEHFPLFVEDENGAIQMVGRQKDQNFSFGVKTATPELSLHVRDGALSGRSTANSNCDMVVEGTTNTGIQFYSGTQVQLRFGDAASTAAGAIIYEHNNKAFKINYETGGEVRFTSGADYKILTLHDNFTGHSINSQVIQLFDSSNAYESVLIHHTGDHGNGTTAIMPNTNPGSGISNQTIKLKNTGSGSGNTYMNLVVDGSLSKGSGSFLIEHPLPSLSSTKTLRHSFIEGPQCDNIYRGKVTLSSGTATVNLDLVSSMTEGTFVVLNRDIQCFTSNETGWDAVKGSVTGNILTITSQNNSSTDTISWMVVGERQDSTIKESLITDDDGNLLVEEDK